MGNKNASRTKPAATRFGFDIENPSKLDLKVFEVAIANTKLQASNKNSKLSKSMRNKGMTPKRPGF